MLKFAICDDEPLMAQEIAAQLTKYMEKALSGPCAVRTFPNGRALLESGESFDLLFLDIQMEQPNGLETAQALRRRGDPCLLVFITVLKELVFDAFEVEAYDFLVKPLDSGRFGKTMDRALKRLKQRAEKSILVRQGTACRIVPLEKIVYCEVQGRKIYIHQSGGEVIDYYDKLENLEHQVDNRFFKCHRSYLVNLDYVRGCRSGQVMLPQGEAIPVSRLRERDLSQALLRCMKEKGESI